MNLKHIAKRILSLSAALLLVLTLSGCEAVLSLLPLDLLPSPPDNSVSADPPADVPITLETVPDWSGDPYVELEYNVPAFTEEDLSQVNLELYAELDALGRCGEAFALVGPETMPAEEREGIGMIKPSGWQTARYDDLVDGKYLYNRCHLIGYQLTGENANELNLITGTRYLNMQGMLPFENDVASYVEKTGNHVLYRVTPIFEGEELVARGVVMEAMSVEDHGEAVCFHVYVYNVQPYITIDYRTGESYVNPDAPAAEETPPSVSPPAEEPEENTADADSENADTDTGSTDDSSEGAKNDAGNEESAEYTYVLNKKSLKFHAPTCEGAQSMSEKNKEYFSGTREEAIAQGYAPCGTCKP